VIISSITLDDKHNVAATSSTASTVELDSTDREIIILITKGYTSAYAVWSAMKTESNTKSTPKKVLAYKNIYQRIINLAKLGFLEEVDLVHMHGRRDFKVTAKGIEHLLETPKIDSINSFLKSIKNIETLSINEEQVTHLLKSTFELNKRSREFYLQLQKLQKVINDRYRRQKIAQEQVIGSKIKTEQIPGVPGGQLTIIERSEDFLGFQNQKQKQYHQSKQQQSIAAAQKKRKH
jgi:hypothetical protein